jgi:predicted LPLAT superfamily acyltransferase
MSQAWLEQRERGSIAGLRFIAGVSLALGRPVARLMLYPVCVYFLLFSVRSRAASRSYLERVLGRSPGIADLFRHYFTFGSVALDRIFLLKDRHALFQTTIHGEEIMHQARERGQGCLLLGAHLGSFEILRALGCSKQLEVALVMYEDNARKINALVDAINPALAQNIIALGRVDSMLKVLERLQKNAWVGVLGDRALDGQGFVEVPFLGRPALFPAAPFRLAFMLKRPIVLMVGLYRGGNRYDVHFERLCDPSGIERSRRAAAVEEAMRLYAQRLEHYCREAPYNWFNFYDFWDDASR